MGIFRFMGRQVAKPVSLRAGAYRAIGQTVRSGRRNVSRALPGSKRQHPPILPNTKADLVDQLYARWAQLDSVQRQQAWQEFSTITPLIMELEAQSPDKNWSLAVPESERSIRYEEISKKLRRSLLIYGALMSFPALFVFKNGGNVVFYLNLLVAGLLLAPHPMRLLIVRAQLFHGGKIGFFKVFRRYPKTLPQNQVGEKRFEKPTSSGNRFPMLCFLYGVDSYSELDQVAL